MGGVRCIGRGRWVEVGGVRWCEVLEVMGVLGVLKVA